MAEENITEEESVTEVAEETTTAEKTEAPKKKPAKEKKPKKEKKAPNAIITEGMIAPLAQAHIMALRAWWKANASEEMIKRAKNKTIEGALAFIMSVAAKCAKREGNRACAMISDDDTYGLLVHYMLDEKEGAIYNGNEVKAKKAKTPAKKSDPEKLGDKYKTKAEKNEAEAKKEEKAKKLKEAAENQLLLMPLDGIS